MVSEAGAGPESLPASAATEEPKAPLREFPTILLAALGLFGALLAWRVAVAGSTAGDANDAGLDAARARSAAIVANEGLISQSREAWLDYERARRRAEALVAAGQGPTGDEYYKVSAANYFFLRTDYLDKNGVYDPDAQRAGLLADAESQQDLDFDTDFNLADDLNDKINGLTLAGFIAAIGLPFLTVAEATRDRRRVFPTFVGAGTLVAAVVLAVLSWA